MPEHCRLCKASTATTGTTLCLTCNRKRFAAYRGATTARRLYTALKQRLRLRREERSKWTLAEVQAVLERWQPPPMLTNVEPKRLRISAVDPKAPLVPSNACVEI